jgi:betaine-aldehyde dehydrogenase
MSVLDPMQATTVELPHKRLHFYGGAWHASANGATMDIEDPATGASLGVASSANAADVDAAVAAGAAAYPGWRDTPAQQRAQCIRAAAAILREHRDELAWLDALDTGNPLSAMRYDVDISVGYMEHFAGLVTEIKGATIPIGP